MAEAQRKRGPLTPWNKGSALTCEHRAKLAAAKLGRTHSDQTKSRMSSAASGRKQSPSTRQKIAESKRGRTLTRAHRQAISEAQKRRHAQQRARRDVSANVAQRSSAGMDAAAFSNLQAALGGGQRSGSSVEELQDQYTRQLREFRSLQEELRIWTEAFEHKHGRKASVEDADRTGIRWISVRFRQLQLLKDKMMADIPGMRSELSEAQRRSSRVARGGPKVPKMQSLFDTAINANHVTHHSRSELSQRVQAALDYKRRVASNGAATASSSGGDGGGAAPARPGLTLAGAGVGVSSDATSRAKLALAKAMEYRKSKGAHAGNGATQRQSAVRLVSVEGKTINGINYDAVDASRAAAGESALVQSGSQPVTSYRRLEDIASAFDGDVPEPTSSSVTSASTMKAEQERDEASEGALLAASAAVAAAAAAAAAAARQRSTDDSDDDDGADGSSGGTQEGTSSVGVVGPSPELTGPLERETVVACTSEPMTMSAIILDLRTKQALATSAMVHAAVIKVMCETSCSKGGQDLVQVGALASLAAQRAVAEFAAARTRVQELLGDERRSYMSGLLVLNT